MSAACGRRSIPEDVPVPPASRGAPGSALEDCNQRIDSSDGTGPCDCLELVDPHDGIDAAEARAIAKAYFAGVQLSEWGGAGPLTRAGEEWLSTAQVGVSGKERVREPIRISARTGAVSYLGHPSFATVTALRASARGTTCWGRPELEALAKERREARR
jgi:hypothetical protein